MEEMAASPSAITSPLIGVLCVDAAQKLIEIYGDTTRSYIAASYVKFLEGAGARVVPIWIGREVGYYDDIMSKINGVLIPGGAVFFDSKYISQPAMRNDCVQSSLWVYRIALRKNAAGEYFPVWGTCLGYELLLLHSADGADLRQDCVRMDCALPLKFEDDFRASSLFANLSKDMEELMQAAPFGYHFHRYCITKEDLRQFKISKHWKVLATNKDSNNLEFISLIEHTSYPIYGCQFHPERICYEYRSDNDACPHSQLCIKAVRYFADFFVEACSKNRNRFPSLSEELRHSICNFPVAFTASMGAHWQQCYLFDDFPDYPESSGDSAAKPGCALW